MVERSRYAEREEGRALGVHVTHNARPMTPLREKYQRDMTVRSLAARTQQSYTSSVADLARWPSSVARSDLLRRSGRLDPSLIRDRHLAAIAVSRTPRLSRSSARPALNIGDRQDCRAVPIVGKWVSILVSCRKCESSLDASSGINYGTTRYFSSAMHCGKTTYRIN